MTALSPPIVVTPDSTAYTLAAATPIYLPGGIRPISVQIKTGGTADVYYTNSTAAEINAGIADWIEWASGAKAGPFAATIPGPTTAIQLVSTLGAVAYVLRG